PPSPISSRRSNCPGSMHGGGTSSRTSPGASGSSSSRGPQPESSASSSLTSSSSSTATSATARATGSSPSSRALAADMVTGTSEPTRPYQGEANQAMPIEGHGEVDRGVSQPPLHYKFLLWSWVRGPCPRG